jgi:hypothetical protein
MTYVSYKLSTNDSSRIVSLRARSTSHEGEIIDHREHMAFIVRYHKLNARRSSEFGKCMRTTNEHQMKIYSTYIYQ